jgi:hypothetical protein
MVRTAAQGDRSPIVTIDSIVSKTGPWQELSRSLLSDELGCCVLPFLASI